MADVVKERIQERDRQVLVRILDLENGIGSSLLIP
jgi:hypothetical protein